MTPPRPHSAASWLHILNLGASNKLKIISKEIQPLQVREINYILVSKTVDYTVKYLGKVIFENFIKYRKNFKKIKTSVK